MFGTKLLKKLFSRDRAADAAHALYGAAVARAREPAFYRAFGVDDSLEGRFEMICLHVYPILRRLKDGDRAAADVAQALFDLMFADMDRNLREMGAGDLGVGRRVKTMAQGFYGRMRAYDDALAQGGDALSQAVARNVYAKPGDEASGAQGLARYLAASVAAVAAQDLDGLLAGRVAFAPLPEDAG